MLDFADLAELEDPATLLTLFRRPQGSDQEFYTRSVQDAGAIPASGARARSSDFARRLMMALYHEPRRRVIASRPSNVDIESLVLAIWGQQWPRLRRTFRFCTMSASDRPADAGPFDLQILPLSERGLRVRFQNAIDVADVLASANAWLDDATMDLAQPDATGLRSFLRRVGGDIEAGREAFLPLARLHSVLGAIKRDPYAVAEAVHLLETELSAPDAGAARVLVARAALEHASHYDEETLQFVGKSLRLLDPETVAQFGAQFGKELWQRRPQSFVGMLGGSDIEKAVAHSVLDLLPLDELLSGLAREPSLAVVALQRRPEVVTRLEFWPAANGGADAAIDLIASQAELHEPALQAAIKSGRQDLARRFVRAVGSRPILTAVEEQYVSQVGNGMPVAAWLNAAAADLDAVNEYLADGSQHALRFLAALSRCLTPDALTDNRGRDPWVCALAGKPINETDNRTSYLVAFLMSRALGWRSTNPGELARLAFEAMHKATAMGTLLDDAWRLLEPRLPWGLGWFPSNRLSRLHSAISELFVDRELPPQLFANLVRDDSLFAQLAEQVANSGRGRRYLKRVLRWQVENSHEPFAHRTHILRSLID